MNKLVKITMQWRIMGGFLLCAAITAFFVTIGIISLYDIRSHMEDTTKEVETSIDKQNAQISLLMPLRTLVISIANTESKESLKDKEKELESFRKSESKNTAQKNILKNLDDLIKLKYRHLQVKKELADLRKTNLTTLEELTILALNVVDRAEFESTLKIDSAMIEIRHNFDKMSSVTDKALSIIKASLSVLSYYNNQPDINPQSTSFNADNELTDFADTEIITMLEEILNSIADWPKNEVTNQILRTLRTLKKDIKKTAAARKGFFSKKISERRESENTIVSLRNKSNSAIEELLGLILEIVEGEGFESAIDIYGIMSSSTETALSTIKAAMSLRYYCNELNIRTKEVLLSEDAASVDSARTDISALLGYAKQNELLTGSESYATDEIALKIDTLDKLTEKMLEAVIQMLAADNELNKASEEIQHNMSSLDSHIIEAAKKMKSNAADTFNKSEQRIKNWTLFQLLFGIFAVLLLFSVGVLISKSANNTIKDFTDGMTESIKRVTSASVHFSYANDQLVSGASKQASSLQKTSESVSTITESTRQNQDKANEVNAMMEATSKVIEQTTYSMLNLMSSIQEISESSDEIKKIINTIDEIAFQTNLLALNANVEAARAGEAGVGFAVVADEVRNLAMRVAKAAKNTSGLIENVARRIEEESLLVARTNKEFSEVSISVTKVDNLVRDIIEVFNEQTVGINQISQAVSELDNVVRQNVENADKSVSAFKELDAQIENMLGFIRILKGLEEQQFFQKDIRIPVLLSGNFFIDGERIAEPFTTRNLSISGVLIATANPIETGTTGQVKIDYDNERIPFVKAQVVREGGMENGEYISALHFTSIKSGMKKILKKIIRSSMDYRRSGI
ncbi:MAG: hypothetical protein GY749_15480 [Desulfobacteraceae bacterium]|nr:hypothetical protein [Desulfobacteraceae bacterium]